jgi:hypothetical protein
MNASTEQSRCDDVLKAHVENKTLPLARALNSISCRITGCGPSVKIKPLEATKNNQN